MLRSLLVSLARLKAGIELTQVVTEREVAGAAEHIPKAIDILLQLPRFASAGERASANDHQFRWWALSVYVNAGHTSWALYDLWRSGLYLESTVLLRSLVEAIVQLRYFEIRSTEVTRLLDPSGKRITFKDMFEAVAPGYYKKWYGLLSSIAHARLGATVFRVEPSMIAVGAAYNEDFASQVLNQFDPILLGLLRLFPRHFPGYASAGDAGLEARRLEEVDWLQRAFDAQVAQFPRSTEWAEVVRPLIDVGETAPVTPPGP